MVRLTVLGAPQAGKTTLITTSVTKVASATPARYAHTKRADVYFTRLKVGPVQLQDVPGGATLATTRDEAAAMRDEWPAATAASISADPRWSSSRDEETARLLTRESPLVARIRSSGYVVVFDANRRDSFEKARALIRELRSRVRGDSNDVAPIAVIANKRDLSTGVPSTLDVSLEAHKLCAEPEIAVFLGSALRNDFSLLASSGPLERTFEHRVSWSIDDVLCLLVTKVRRSPAWERELRRRAASLASTNSSQSQHPTPTSSNRKADLLGDDVGDGDSSSCWQRCCGCCFQRSKPY